MPDVEVEREMRADTALYEELRVHVFTNSRLRGQANLLIFPTLNAANSAFNLVKVLGEGALLLSYLALPAHPHCHPVHYYMRSAQHERRRGC